MVVPVGAVASLLSYDEIKNKLPWLPRLIDRSPRLEALIQTTLPTLAVVTFNGLSPFLLECTYTDQIEARLMVRAILSASLYLEVSYRVLLTQKVSESRHLVAELISGTTSYSSLMCSLYSCSRARTGSSLAMRQ